jgi:hypothetical protein
MLKSSQKSDKNHPTTSIVAEKPLTEAQWVNILPIYPKPSSTC